MGKSNARKQMESSLEKEEIARGQMELLKQQYAALDTSNPFLDQTNYMAGLENVYSGLDNQMAGLTNVYSGLENTMEDLTVNQQQAEFERQTFQQSQANILGGLRGAAGGSGIGALAQSLAQQGQIASQRSAASIGQQEALNQRAAAAQAGQLQMAEAGYGGQLQQMRAQEASRLQGLEAGYAGQLQMSEAQQAQALQTMERQGDVYSRGLEYDKIATLLGMSQMETAGYAEQAMNWQGERGKGWDLLGQFMGAASDVGGAMIAAGSDRKLKKNIKLIGYSPSGLKIYLFEYIDKAFGDGTFQGVMSDEVPQLAVTKHKDGYDLVDYSKIDVEFKKVI